MSGFRKLCRCSYYAADVVWLKLMKLFIKIIFGFQFVFVIGLGLYSIYLYKNRAAPAVVSVSAAKQLVASFQWPWTDSTETEPPQETLTTAADANNARQSSDLLFSADFYGLPENQHVAISPELLQEYESVKRRFSPDTHLKLIKYGGEDFKTSTLRTKLNQVRTVKLYVIARFDKPIDFPMISQLKRLGFSPLNQYPLSEYIDKKLGIFYVRYYKLLPAVTTVAELSDIYILTQYTARGFYQLGMKSLALHDELELEVKFPYSKSGRELLYKKNTITGTTDFAEKVSDDFKSIVTAPLTEGQIVTFHSDLRYHILLEKLLDTHIYVQGANINPVAYRKQMQEYHANLNKEFTSFSEKIVPSVYVNSIIKRINTNDSIAEIWKQLTRILDREIAYDWQKRELFFSGNLTYHNIKNMYMTAEELGRKRKGACTERASLEIALLRELGIAARAATRLYHIYTEIYIPGGGWTTTSLTLNEIPLDASQNEDMSYFVSWAPEHPIRLKWGGYMYPNIIF